MGDKQPKILITGTGRCGTTFLMRLLTVLDFDTGYDKDTMEIFVYKNCNSGLEKSVDLTKPLPRVCKSPRFCTMMRQIHSKYDIEMVFIPIRDLEECARSRARHHRNNGGFPKEVNNIDEMRDLQEKRLARLIVDVVLLEIPYTFLSFSRMIKDPIYLYDKLKCVLDKDLLESEFEKAYTIATSAS